MILVIFREFTRFSVGFRGFFTKIALETRLFAGFLSMFCLAFPVLAQQSPQISISGAENGLVTNIRSHLRITGEDCDTADARLERLRPQLLTNVQRAGQALGYYRMAVTAEFSRDENCWALALMVTPGEQIPVSGVSVNLPEEIEIQGVFSEILANLPVQAGDPLHHGDYEGIKNALSAAAIENGYFSARFNRAELQVDLAAYQATIVIDFEPGERYRFGVIEVSPVPGLSEAFIDSMMTLKPGDPYSSDALLQQRVSLDDTQYFRQISITPQLSRAENLSVPVMVELVPRLRHAWSTGIGFTTDTGPRVRAAYENRYINSRGHTFDSDASVSVVRSQLNLGYTIPMNDPLSQSLHFGTGLITEDTDTYDSDRFKLEASYTRASSTGWLETYSVDYLLDDFVLDQQADRTQLTMAGYSLSKTSGDNLINPTRGWRLFGQVRGAADSFISDTTFMQLYASGKGIMSIGSGRILARFELGSTWIDDVSELPVSVRYFAGGDQSIRGYDFRTLGPVNNNGEVTGGKHLITGSMEYDFPFKNNNWRAALFYDGGNAFSSDTLDWKDSVGVGVRWLSPIGPIRIDLAHALEGDNNFRLHITMGPDL